MSVNTEPTSQSAARVPTFHAADAESLPDYRTLSALALVSFVIGLLSPLCFAAPLVLTIPLFGIAVALVALRRIAVSDGALAGRWAATTGLALCVASLLAVLSYGQVMRFLQVRQAEEFGRKWIALLQSGDTEPAFRLTSQGAQPAPPVDEGGPPQKNPYDEFLANPLVKQLAATGASGQVRLDNTLSYEGRPHGLSVVGQRFEVSPDSAHPTGAESQREPVSVVLRLQRARLPGEGRPRWLVVGYESGDASAGGRSSR